MTKKRKNEVDRNQLSFQLDEVLQAYEQSFITELIKHFDKIKNKFIRRASNIPAFINELDNIPDKEVTRLKKLLKNYYKNISKESIKALNKEIAILTGQRSNLVIIGNESEGLRYRAEQIAIKKARDYRDVLKSQINESNLTNKKEMVKMIQKQHNLFVNRHIKVVARMESVTAANLARLDLANQTDIIKGFQFIAVIDKRTTDICRPRHLMILKVGDPRLYTSFRPPCHFGCRSILSPVTIYEKNIIFTSDLMLDKVPPKFFGNKNKTSNLLVA